MPKSLDPDQARHYVGPGLGPDFLLRLSAPSLKNPLKWERDKECIEKEENKASKELEI